MTERVRLERLRALLVRLERTPPSAARDWMLTEVRARAVDVETGETPAALRALPGDEVEREILATLESPIGEAAETIPPPKPKRRRASRRAASRHGCGALAAELAIPASRSSPSPVRQPPARETVVDLLEQGGVLCLDEQPEVPVGTGRSWLGGLRG